ncbi:hypothetical protein LTR53_015041 [Teratosphaeriaceae sp. CCFEE 6253]|nr:hypothetical protein LTR53_015041 [Teratosphaeriaceae sp. CCFEE 6253]
MASKQSNDDTSTRPALSPTVAEHSIQQPDGLATLKNAGDRWSEHLMAFRLLDQGRTQANMVSEQLQIIVALMDEKIDEADDAQARIGKRRARSGRGAQKRARKST